RHVADCGELPAQVDATVGSHRYGVDRTVRLRHPAGVDLAGRLHLDDMPPAHAAGGGAQATDVRIPAATAGDADDGAVQGHRPAGIQIAGRGVDPCQVLPGHAADEGESATDVERVCRVEGHLADVAID